MHPFIETQKEWLRNIPPFRAGDTLRVNVRVKEGEKERVQIFTGIVIAKKGIGINQTFTVRRISYGELDAPSLGVEDKTEFGELSRALERMRSSVKAAVMRLS